jgi:hypothetical protein
LLLKQKEKQRNGVKNMYGGYMKKIGLLLVITLMVIGSVIAQNQEARKPPEPITVQGTLQLKNGFIAVASGETVYYVGMLNRYIGFIEGLKEGNTITIEGYAFKNFLHPVKATISGKTYDFPAMGPGGFAQQQGQWRGDRHQPYNRHGNYRYGQGHYRHGPAPMSRYGHGSHRKPMPSQRYAPSRRPVPQR